MTGHLIRESPGPGDTYHSAWDARAPLSCHPDPAATGDKLGALCLM